MKLLRLEDYKDLESKKVIEYFIEISKIPRKSGEERKIREYLERFAKKRNLFYIKDEYENIIIYKKATQGREKEETLAFQAHTDMICEKDLNAIHDFSKDPIVLYKDKDYITAKGTTLGADNGIGVAYMLTILDSDMSNPNIECIFTVQEETTMLGAIKIDEKNIKSRKIISLDNGKEGEIITSSANCNEWKGKIKANKKYIKTEKIYRLKYNNFLGGHSGGNIGDKKRGNPLKLAMEILKDIPNIQIVKLAGGSRVNVIPRECVVDFYIPINNEKLLISNIHEKISNQKEYFKKEIIELETIIKNVNIYGYSTNTSKTIINFVNEFINGALERDQNNNIILSTNLAVLDECKNGIQIEFSERSNSQDLERIYLDNLLELLKKYKIEVIWHQELKGVEKRENNILLDKCQKNYKKIFNRNLREIISQGVLEGGFLVCKIPCCEYVCIGPNIYDAHSPRESVSISSIERIWRFIKELIIN